MQHIVFLQLFTSTAAFVGLPAFAVPLVWLLARCYGHVEESSNQFTNQHNDFLWWSWSLEIPPFPIFDYLIWSFRASERVGVRDGCSGGWDGFPEMMM